MPSPGSALASRLFASLVLLLVACDRNTVVVSEKTPPVTSFRITDPRDGKQLALAWTNPPARGFTGVRVLRRAGEAPLGAGDAFAQVAYEGAREAWSDEGFDGASVQAPLVVGTTYHYAVFALYGDEASAPARASDALSFFGPAATFTATATDDGAIALAWTLPDPRGDIAGVVVRRATGASPGDPAAKDEQVVFEGDALSFRDADVRSGTRHFYALATRDAAGAESTALRADDVTRPGAVTNLTATPDARGRISLAWRNPPDERFVAARVVRKVGDAPAGPSDGAVVCDSPGAASCLDASPSPGRATHYGVFARDADGRTAAGAFASAQAVDPIVLRAAQSFGGAGVDDVQAIVAGRDGSVVVAGRFGDKAPAGNRAARFGSGGAQQSATSYGDEGAGFLAKFAANGALAWVRTIAGSGEVSWSTSAFVDASIAADDSVLAIGTYSQAATFAGGGTSVTLQPVAPNCATTSGHSCLDLFFAKYAANGTLLWAKRAGAGEQARISSAGSILALADGGAFAVGAWNPKWNSANAPSPFLLNEGAIRLESVSGYDAGFVLRLDSTGRVTWAKVTGGDMYTSVHAMKAALLPNADLVVTGAHWNAVTLGEGAAARSFDGGGLFVARYSGAGALAWAQFVKAGAYGVDPPTPVVVGNEIVAVANTRGKITFGSGAGALQRGSGDDDRFSFLAHYDAATGALGRVDELRAEGLRLGAAVATPDGGIVVGAVFHGAFSIGPFQLQGPAADPYGSNYALAYARLDASGAPLWVRSSGNAGEFEEAACLAAIGDGEYAIGGRFHGAPRLFADGASPAALQSGPSALDDGFFAFLFDGLP